MEITLHTLGHKHKTRKNLGRGNASGHGTTAGRGSKGQRSRSGGKKGLKLKGFRQNLLNLPKFKGMKSPRSKNQIVKLSDLVKKFTSEKLVNPGTLLEKGLIRNTVDPVKVLLDVKEIKLEQQFEISSILVSKTVREILEKAGAKFLDPEEDKAEVV
ncbi:MAG: 50S ribosomal protein L15 [Parcubacteria group bacterium GW2011_GWC2_39_14]|nr:MAG: 50S ribosomal protein L15 [Parcubacteria group bacterium GW2011_GWC2_39_14]KKR55487.1 MAG: 50S ribosomal protein L15 [Parcubacteria group bacterium GW2011_GWA2_40_23]